MLTELFDTVFTDPSISPFKEAFDNILASLGAALPYVLIALCLIVGLFGRRLSGLIRVLILFSAGFIAGAGFVAPAVADIIPLFTPLSIGLVIGLITAALSFFIYNVLYAGCIGYDVYAICFGGTILAEITAFTKGNQVLCIIIAVVTVVLAFLLRKYLEMLLTSGIGGIGIAYVVKGLYDYTALVPLEADTVAIIAGSVLALIMFVIQFRTRIRF